MDPSQSSLPYIPNMQPSCYLHTPMGRDSECLILQHTRVMAASAQGNVSTLESQGPGFGCLLPYGTSSPKKNILRILHLCVLFPIF